MGYLTLESIRDPRSLVISRINFTHFLLLSLYDTVPESGSVLRGERRDYFKKEYLLMKKSRKKRWADISLYNFNEDAPVRETAEGILSVEIPFGDPVTVPAERFNTPENYDELYRRAVDGPGAEERNGRLLKERIADEFNIFSDILNVRRVDSQLPLHYIKQSATTGSLTLYFFYFYTVSKYDVTSLPGGITDGDGRLSALARREIAGILERDRFSLHGTAGWEAITGIEFDNTPVVRITGRGRESSAPYDGDTAVFFNRLQLDQVNELASRETTQCVPRSFFRTDCYPGLHPNYDFHDVIDLVVGTAHPLAAFLDGSAPLADFDNPILKARPGTPGMVGFLMADLIDCKRFFLGEDQNSGYEALKAFQNDVADILHANYGYIIQTAGDGIYAFVHPSGGTNEKLEVYRCLLRVSLLIEESGWDTRIGLDFSSEPYYEGYIGPIELEEYTISGVNVNIAARLEKGLKNFEGVNRGVVMPAPSDIGEEWVRGVIEATLGRGKAAGYEVKRIEYYIPEAARGRKKELKDFYHIYAARKVRER